eukprot:scaffold3274_cov63-Phaeocystis_antarctica.AAC.1
MSGRVRLRQQLATTHGSNRARTWHRRDDTVAHVEIAPKRSPRTPGVASKDLKRVHWPREGDRAADGYARARVAEVVPAGQGGCGMRGTDAWDARDTCRG